MSSSAPFLQVTGEDASTDEAIAEFCSNTDAQNVVYEELGGTKVIKMSDSTVVKIGATEQEARNQRIARTLVDPNIVHIPMVHRFFRIGELGYLVMERIDGKRFNDLNPSLATSRLLAMLHHFNQIRGGKAGPFAGGTPSGLIWDSCYDAAPQNTSEIEEYFNTRLRRCSKELTFSQRDPIFCHLDLADRNIRYLDSGAVAVLDWSSAGFYPPAMEHCALYLNKRQGDSLVDSILKELETSNTYLDAQLLWIGWANGQKNWLSVNRTIKCLKVLLTFCSGPKLMYIPSTKPSKRRKVPATKT